MLSCPAVGRASWSQTHDGHRIHSAIADSPFPSPQQCNALIYDTHDTAPLGSLRMHTKPIQAGGRGSRGCGPLIVSPTNWPATYPPRAARVDRRPKNMPGQCRRRRACDLAQLLSANHPLACYRICAVGDAPMVSLLCCKSRLTQLDLDVPVPYLRYDLLLVG